jgi:hypothetical protein
MKLQNAFTAAAALLVLMLAAIRTPAAAAPNFQLTDFPTPTPLPDGRILYTVQTGDTLWRIAAVSGLTVDELRQLNNLSPDAIINPGDVLLLGFAGGAAPEATATPEGGIIPTPSNLLPTPTSGPGTGIVCILLYDDTNGDATRQDTELSIGGGAVSLTNQGGSVSLENDTVPGPADPAVEDPPRVCWEDLPEGDYNATVALPDGYNPTTHLTLAFNLRGGDETYIDFGAQLSTEGIEAEEVTIPEEGGRSPTLGIIGGVLLLGGLGLAAAALFMTRRG